MKKSKFIFLILFLTIIFTGAVIYAQSKSLDNKTYTVMLNDGGFSPPELTINKGDTVNFTTSLNEEFWPASNLHPTHTIFPEFDPKKPIEPESAWSFTFEKVGEWKYHDHLSPIFKGSVIVKSEDFSSVSCGNNENKLKCFEGLIDNTLKKEGLEKAFEDFAVLFESEPEFGEVCHDFAHKLGEKAYFLFAEKKDFPVSEKSFYCGYGFYHGFMESLLQDLGDMNQARDFCEYVDRKLKKTTSDAGGACYHGIGHGAVDGSDPATWGDPDATVKTALNLCEMVSNDENPPPRYGKLYRCISGVFNSLEILSSSNKYKLSIKESDPFSICVSQPAKYKEACFTQFVIAAMNVSGGDFVKSARFIDGIKEDDYAIPAMQTLVIELVGNGKKDYATGVNFCRNLSVRFQIPCISAYAEGFLKYGPPEKEYIESLNFCSFSALNQEEKSVCFKRVLSLLRIFYTKEKSYDICMSVPSEYRFGDCHYN